jgi:hypothetical protein
MKKILLYTITMIFVLTLGVAYAEEDKNFGSNEAKPDNFYDIGPADVSATSVEGANAGGMRSVEPGIELNNGVTDVSGRTYDTLSDISMAAPGASRVASVEGSHAGGPRTEISGKGSLNGISDFSGSTCDSL